jgi:trans-aconitate methyltransferase
MSQSISDIAATGRTETANALLARWDAQQTAYIKHRDQRFAVMADTIRRVCGPAPRVLDLACGPGSLTASLRRAIPEASVVALDKDPVLLAVARDVFAGDDRVMVGEADFDVPDWRAATDQRFDAVGSSTALHWLMPERLAALYFELAEIVVPGGLFMNADHLLYDAQSEKTLRRVALIDDEDNQQAAFGAGVDDWDQWWTAASAVPDYAEAVARRPSVWTKDGPRPKVTLGYHLEALRSAGFVETGTVWQYLDDYVVCAVR